MVSQVITCRRCERKLKVASWVTYCQSASGRAIPIWAAIMSTSVVTLLMSDEINGKDVRSWCFGYKNETGALTVDGHFLAIFMGYIQNMRDGSLMSFTPKLHAQGERKVKRAIRSVMSWFSRSRG